MDQYDELLKVEKEEADEAQRRLSAAKLANEQQLQSKDDTSALGPALPMLLECADARRQAAGGCRFSKKLREAVRLADKEKSDLREQLAKLQEQLREEGSALAPALLVPAGPAVPGALRHGAAWLWPLLPRYQKRVLSQRVDSLEARLRDSDTALAKEKGSTETLRPVRHAATELSALSL